MFRMTLSWQRWCRKLSLVGSLFTVAVTTTTQVQAQITPDSTLGSLVNGSTASCSGICTITGGTDAMGKNLFHSFQEFSISAGGVAFFDNAVNIQNIIARVTGNNSVSNIDGLIQANGTANLFLINPNGIIFGSDAQLRIGGSFVATTANALQFGNDSSQVFGPGTGNNVALLTINPSAFLFNQMAAQITSQSTAAGLEVPDGKSLLLVGGNVSLDGGRLVAPGGRVELGGLAGAGKVGLSVNGNQLSLNFPDGVARADVSLANGSEVDVRDVEGGSIAINVQNLTLAQGNRSRLLAGIVAGGLPNSRAGDIKIDAKEKITLDDASFISNSIQSGGIGRGGDIHIKTGVLSASNGSQIFASTRGQGDAGKIIIYARDWISFDGQRGPVRSSGAVSEVELTGFGKGGSITITTPSLSITNGGTVTTGTLGQGDAGSVTINATNSLYIDGQGSDPDPSLNGGFFSSGIYSRIQAGGEGNPGSITIMTGLLSVTNGGVVTTSTAGKGDAGSVTINADQIRFDGEGSPSQSGFIPSSGAFSAVREGAEGNAGNIDITAGSLSVTKGAVVTTMTLGRGNAGTVKIKADTVSFDGQGSDLYASGAYSSVGDPTVTSIAVGNGGGIIITTGSLSITNGAQVNASTFGDGEAGNIQVNDANSITISGVGLNGVSSGIFTSTEQGAIGKGGEITVNANTLEVKDGAVVNARTLNDSDGGSVTIKANTIEATNGGQVITTTRGDGRAGNITINDADRISLSGGAASGLFANTQGAGDGGGLKIFTNQLIVREGAQVSADSSGTGRAGTLTVNASEFIEVSGTSADGGTPSSLFFDASGSGNAGELKIDTKRLEVLEGGRVSAATSDTGRGGIIDVTATDSVNISGTSGNNQFASGLYFDSSGSGDARGININTRNLTIENGGRVTVSGTGSGTPGDIEVKATTVELNNQGQLTAETKAGSGGNVRLRDLNSLTLSNNSQISTSTENGQGGTLEIAASDFVNLSSGSSLSSQATGNGSAGSLKITTGELTIQDHAQATVSSTGTGTSGDLEVITDAILLNNQGRLTATTASAEGGNIRLQVADSIILRDNSEISAEASNNGNGGNITINAGGFVVAFLSENSDVVANAFQGRGGNIAATAQGIFGFRQFRDRRTSESDFTASSATGIDGIVEVNTPDRPQPDALEDQPLPDLIDQRCQVGRRRGNSSEFIVSGRGGLPPNPSQILDSDTGWVDFRSSIPNAENRSSLETTTKPNNSASAEILEAQGWIVNAKGNVELTAVAPNATLYSSWQTPVACLSQSDVEK